MNFFKKLFGKPEPTLPEPPPPPPLPPEPEPLHVNEVSCQELNTWLEGNEPISLIDLRQTWEYESGHIAGAINIPMMNLPAKLAELPKDQKIVIQCYHGYTSLDASGFLLENGWADEHVFSLMGGMSQWVVNQGIESLVPEE